MRRNDLTLVKETLPKVTIDLENKSKSFKLLSLRSDKSYTFPFQILARLDETAVYYNLTTHQIIDKKCPKTVNVPTICHEIKHFTCVMTFIYDGIKLSTMNVYKRKTMPIESFPLIMVVNVSDNGLWMKPECLFG